MADMSLDEVIRRRGFNAKGPVQRPMFGRGAGVVGRKFDARQKIGMTDVRQRLGGGGIGGLGTAFQGMDAREKIVQKDARFKIRGGGAAAASGGVQDARPPYVSQVSQQGQSIKKMADISLDEVIRRRGFNAKGPVQRPMFGRGAGGVGRKFDARQKIGMTDVRQRLGGGGIGGLGTAFQGMDAREKIVQKDARFKIRGGGAAAASGGVQDARQMINSRKQGHNNLFNVAPQTIQQQPAAHLQTHVQQIQVHANYNIASVNARQFTPNLQGLNIMLGGIPKRMMVDARDRLSLKRSIGGTQTQGMGGMGGMGGLGGLGGLGAIPPMKITKTIQPGTMGSSFSMSGPITKVVKNDAYTAPRPPVPVAPTRPNPSAGPARSSASTLQPVSMTLQQSGPTGGDANPPPAPTQPTFSPLEGTKITVNNLHPRVTEEDIVEDDLSESEAGPPPPVDHTATDHRHTPPLSQPNQQVVGSSPSPVEQTGPYHRRRRSRAELEAADALLTLGD